MRLGRILMFFVAGFLAVPVGATGQLPVPPEPNEALQNAFPGQRNYSPYAGRNFPTAVYWGDTHLHTGMSMDAGAFGARLLPEDAHRFARGEELTSSTGQRVKLSRPLDFLVVADHSDNMGFFPRLRDGEPDVLADPTGRRWYDLIQEGGQAAVGVAVEIIQGLTQGTFPEALASLPGTPAYRNAWQVSIDAAEQYNEPGVYTAFHGYEWTSTEGGINLHRVVVMRDAGDKAEMVLPATTVPPLGSPDPTYLWEWMQDYEDKTGGDILAIAHNGNMSNGAMFSLTEHFDGQAMDREYFETRARWEPLYEVTQIKGDGEAHPFLSPNDEFADYETWDQGNLDLSEFKTDDMLQYEYAREALKIGLQVEDEFGVNPYKFGLVGATDSHTGLATAQEDNFFGKHSGAEPSAERVHHPMAKVGDAEYTGWGMVASGLQGVWARENTREALFDAMERKETYATTGSRMLVRFFGGWEFTDDDARRRLPADVGYLKGVPMGGDLPERPAGAGAPTFLVAAVKDAYSGNLDRIQIVKGWMENGERMERIYDVVWAGDRRPGSDGKLPPVGNTVDVASASWTNTIGAPELITTWEDPDFDPSQRAVYYARVIEIPTPRWTAYEAARYGIDMDPEIPMVHQERAYTSPIWYSPN
ncbi:MAG: hypothetical protein AMS19_08900 [Gemmatimonas sp. SG8_23]|jgi:hypothetical protein|nr:MAG: hypothetical protein AMS19_08900 [Gemmatimonas sp. SG8_23]